MNRIIRRFTPHDPIPGLPAKLKKDIPLGRTYLFRITIVNTHGIIHFVHDPIPGLPAKLIKKPLPPADTLSVFPVSL